MSQHNHSQPLLLSVVSWKTTRGTWSRDHAVDPLLLSPPRDLDQVSRAGDPYLPVDAAGFARLTYCGRRVGTDCETTTPTHVGAQHDYDAGMDGCARCGMTRRAMVEANVVPLCLAVLSCKLCREQVLLREERKRRTEQQHLLYARYLKMAPWQPSWTSGLVNYQ